MLSDHVLRTDMIESIRRIPEGLRRLRTFGPALKSADDRESNRSRSFLRQRKG